MKEFLSQMKLKFRLLSFQHRPLPIRHFLLQHLLYGLQLFSEQIMGMGICIHHFRLCAADDDAVTKKAEDLLMGKRCYLEKIIPVDAQEHEEAGKREDSRDRKQLEQLFVADDLQKCVEDGDGHTQQNTVYLLLA
jgi:hypothetical protein